jgi:heme exporter protein D
MTLAGFFAMGGYAFYVWGAYGLAALLIAGEIVAVRVRLKNARQAAREAGGNA